MKRVGLLVGLRRPPHWEDVVHALTGVAEIRYAADPRTEPMDAWLASSPRVPGLSRAVATGVPVAVVTDEPCPDVLRATSTPGPLYFPRDGIDASARVPVSPFVRARWRRKAGLPETLVVRTDDEAIDDNLRPTALALASAVIASGRHVVEALAWGAPTVTDAESAAAAQAEAGVEVLVGGEAEARALAADDRRAAVLGRAGRRLVERVHDTAQASRALRRALGLEVDVIEPQARIASALDELWTPAGAAVRSRAAALVVSG